MISSLRNSIEKRVLGWLFGAILMGCSTAAAQEQIGIINTTPEPIRLFVLVRGAKEYNPAMYLGVGQVGSITLTSPKDYYLVYRDQLKRAIPIGWVDLNKMAGETPQIAIDTVYRQNGWWTGWRYVSGYREPRWVPDGEAYAWRAKLRPFHSGCEINHEIEVNFLNARGLEFSFYDNYVYYDAEDLPLILEFAIPDYDYRLIGPASGY